MVHYGFEEQMPATVPPQCRGCPIRDWAEFFRTLSTNGQLIADSLHDVLGRHCIGAVEVKEDNGWSKNVCLQPDVQSGTLDSALQAHFAEAKIETSTQIFLNVARQALSHRA